MSKWAESWGTVLRGTWIFKSRWSKWEEDCKEVGGEIGLGVLRVKEGENFKDKRRISLKEGSSFRSWLFFFFFNVFKCFYERNQETQVLILGQEDPLEEKMATHSSILAWEILWTVEPSVLQSMGLQSQTQLKWLSRSKHERKYRELPVAPAAIQARVIAFRLKFQ